ncbi:hypothetical protein OXX80_012282 [Metschnikowia pulcherrima]
MVGESVHAANTARPGIAYATSNMSRYLIGLATKHFNAAAKVCIKGVQDTYSGSHYDLHVMDLESSSCGE